MGRDVVHLAGDGHALGLHAALGLGLAGALGRQGALLEGLDAVLMLAQAVAGESGRQGQGHVLHHGELGEHPGLIGRRGSEQEHGRRQRAGPHDLAAAALGRQGEQGHERACDGQRDAAHLRLQQTPRQDGPQKHRPGEAPARHQRQRDRSDGSQRHPRGHHGPDAHEAAHEVVGDEQVHRQRQLQAREPEGPRGDNRVDEPVDGGKFARLSEKAIHTGHGNPSPPQAPYTSRCMTADCYPGRAGGAARRLRAAAVRGLRAG